MSGGADRVEFTKEMKGTYTLLFPNMLDIHFRIIRNIFSNYGYNVELLTNTGRSVVDEGLKYVHNDTCYPALLTIGQMISALKSGKYDLNRTALMMTQTGGGCRASNYIHLLRKALKNAGMEQIPVVSVSASGMEKNSGFKITIPMLRRGLAAVVYGDLLMLLSNQTRPYEVNKGETDALVSKWVEDLSESFKNRHAISTKSMQRYFKRIVESFESVQIVKTEKIKVGIVGEIYAKYSPLANNELEKFLRGQDCEVMVPGVLSFLIYMIDCPRDDVELYGGNKLKRGASAIFHRYLLRFEKYMMDVLKSTRKFKVPVSYARIKELAATVIGRGCKMGEGWFLTAEMLELTETGYENIVCAQPFGCLPNHIVGKGMIRQIKQKYPQSNIVAIDYDPGATKVNQENRIKLMLAVAKERLAQGD